MNVEIIDEVPPAHGLFFRGPVQTKDNLRDIRDVFELPQNIFKYRKVCRVCIFTGQKGQNQDGFLPSGVKRQLLPEVFAILPEDMK